MKRLFRIAILTATLLLPTGGFVFADDLLWGDSHYHARSHDAHVVVVRHRPVQPLRYDGARDAYAYAPVESDYVIDEHYPCQLPPSSIDYVPCSQN